jgi:hypothetical protein
MRVASAAVVAGALFIAGLQLFSGKPELTDPVATNPDTTQNQVAQNSKPVIKEIEQASTQELEDFIETVDVTAAVTPKKKRIDKEAEELLKDVSVSEMESFLSSIPMDEELLVTN